MIRFAAHHIRYKKLHTLSYIELDDEHRLIGVFPLVDEIERTTFVDGTIYPLPAESTLDPLRFGENKELWEQQADGLKSGDQVRLFRIGIGPATELGTYHGCGNGHVE